jgi:hypothetical protein
VNFAQHDIDNYDAFLNIVFSNFLDANAYADKYSLERALKKLFNTTKKNFFGPKQIVDEFIIYTAKEEMPRHRKEEIERNLRQRE